MFGFFASQNRKMRATARNWIESAQTVWNYRRDLLSEADGRELRARTEDLRAKVAAKADAAELKLAIESLEPVLTRTGGKIFPKTSMSDNVEFVLIVAIVILGIRAYIAQPFKIPTNSMWPSYYGMTADNLLARNEDPSLLARAGRLLAFGAIRYEASAADTGEITVKIDSSGRLANTRVKGRKWLVLPTDLREYSFYVNGAETKIRVPDEFSDLDSIVFDTLFGGREAYIDALQKANASRALQPVLHAETAGHPATTQVYLFKTGKKVKKGDALLRFDILTGDQLFVDRISYNFVCPSVGDGFVFRTGKIELLDADNYYIKRLVGLPGDTLEIKTPVLYRNGAPITGAEAFGLNAHCVGLYKGYVDSTALRSNWPNLRHGETLTVPENAFFALGDNSYNSLDGRYWGFVPAKEVIGRPFCIFYPFTRRWGMAR